MPEGRIGDEGRLVGVSERPTKGVMRDGLCPSE